MTNIEGKVILTEEQIIFFNNHGLKVPDIMSLQLLQNCDAIAQGYVRVLILLPNLYRTYVLLDFFTLMAQRNKQNRLSIELRNQQPLKLI